MGAGVSKGRVRLWCESCRAEENANAPEVAAGATDWLVLSPVHTDELTLTFCSWPCLAEHATAQVMIDSGGSG